MAHEQWRAVVRRAGQLSCICVLALFVRVALGQTNVQFQDHAKDPRVSFEPGADKLADLVANALPVAIAKVESAQYGPFAKKVRVLVSASEESYRALSGARGESRAATFFERVFISPRAGTDATTVAAVLTHELSHLHLAMQIPEAVGRRIPTWFHEGLAVIVADGGGAERVSEEEARAAIREGRRFSPESIGDPAFIRTAAQFGLSPHMYYRQCALFVSHLRDSNPENFRKLMATVIARKPFDSAAIDSLGASVEGLWQQFLTDNERRK